MEKKVKQRRHQRGYRQRENVYPSVVQKVDYANHFINLFPVNSAIDFPNTHPLDSDLSGE